MKGGYLGGWFAVCGLRTDRRDGWMDGWVHDRLCIHVALFPSLFCPWDIQLLLFRYHEPAQMLCAPLFCL